MNDRLGDRIKKYEDAYRQYLPNRLPVILRLDGKTWHTYTKKCTRPFDEKLISCLNDTAKYLVKNIQSAKLAYLQSDEISILIYNSNFDTEYWFGNNIQKVVSVSAAMASSYFTSISDKIFGKINPTFFDARVFVVPLDEVVNVFEWRQQDCTRNSVQMLARSLYSHSQCNNKNNSELQEMCFQKGQNWNNLNTSYKRGRCIIKKEIQKGSTNPLTVEKVTITRGEWIIDNEIPIFHEHREYIEGLL